MSMQLVFIHGWGFGATMWEGILSHLSPMQTTCVDLGFLGGPANRQLEITDQTVIVAHSLGVMWALEHMGQQPRGLISICGFDRFSPPVPRRNLELMKRGLMKNAGAQMSHFWRSCAVEPFASREELDQAALLEGLDLLMNGNARTIRANLSCPVLALGVRDDEIVPEAMSRSIWGDRQISWLDEGGHGLPLNNPSWCAKQIEHFVDHLQGFEYN